MTGGPSNIHSSNDIACRKHASPDSASQHEPGNDPLVLLNAGRILRFRCRHLGSPKTGLACPTPPRTKPKTSSNQNHYCRPAAGSESEGVRRMDAAAQRACIWRSSTMFVWSTSELIGLQSIRQLSSRMRKLEAEGNGLVAHVCLRSCIASHSPRCPRNPQSKCSLIRTLLLPTTRDANRKQIVRQHR